MKHLYTLLFIVVLFVSGCQPSETAIQPAIALTQAANPTSTFTPIQSTDTPTTILTATPTNTPTIEPTATNAPTPTPDIRIIIGDAEDYILQKSDLLDKYVLRPGDSSPHLNEEILGARGVEEGKAYLRATGRIKGWIIWYNLVSPTAIAPEWIRSYIVMYQTAEGPTLAMGPEWNKDLFDQFKRGELERVEDKSDLGDENLAYFFRERQSDGQYFVVYYIEFRYRNVWAQVLGEGVESDVQPEYIENLARIVLSKLQEAPLSSP